MVQILTGDCREVLRTLPEANAQTCVTSPPYWGLRDYGVDGQLGLEKTPEEYVQNMVSVFREVRRVLKDDGTLWLNLGDSYAAGGHGGGGVFMDMRGKEGAEAWAHRSDKKGYRMPPAGLKMKDLVGIPWMVAFALRADGWYLRSDIIWHKPNPMPESVRDRPTKAHEYIFLLAKSEDYFFDHAAFKEPAVGTEKNRRRRTTKLENRNRTHKQDQTGNRQYVGFNARYFSKDAPATRNRRTVWTVTTKPFKGAHFATFPEDLILPCVLAGSRPGDTVLDPFNGAGTTGLVASKHGRSYVGVDLNPAYVKLAEDRIKAA